MVPLLLCLCGCTPGGPSIYVPPAEIARCPELSGVLFLRASGTAIHPTLKVPTNWRLNGTATVIAHRAGWWYAVTCWHCVAHEGAQFTVDGHSAESWVEDAAMDLAIVRFRADRHYPQYQLGSPEIGQTIYTVGWTTGPSDDPRDLRGGASIRHVRRGIVSWLHSNTLGFDAGGRVGFSGGPLLSTDGKIVGINQRLYTSEGVFAAAIHPRHVEALLYTIPE